ncbi:MAG: peptide chain release factor N(5)-glutamine methyltransferase [Metamycoplasmataceae bacterium]
MLVLPKMPSIDDLLLEKKRYGLIQKVSNLEKIKLKIGMPVQKIIGYIEMSNVKIKVNKKVLIPRYETEELIEIAKDLIVKNNYIRILDLCSGTGFIGIALKKWNNKLDIVCADIDKNAISQSKINANLNNVDIKIIKSNVFENVSGEFDLIISNPPYINFREKASMSKSVLWFEPKKALFASDNGMFFYKKIDKEHLNFLSKHGALLFEINPLNSDYFESNGYINLKDINNKIRFSILKSKK